MELEDVLSVTPQALSDALGTPVSDFEATLLGRFSCELWRLDVTLASGARRDVVLKRPKPEPGREPMDAERRFYERYGRELESSPRYLGYVPDVDGILLEFVDGLEHFDWRTGPGERHEEASIEALAALHRVDPGNIDWLPRFDAQRVERMAREYDIAWKARREMLLEFCPQFAATGDHLVGRLADALARLDRPRCLLHGDAHGENMPARLNGGVCVLDWQDPMLGSPGVDVADYLLMSYPIADRRRTRVSFIDRHAALLARDDYDPIEGFRLGALQRVVRTTRSAHAFPDWSNSSLPWVFERCATGALDAAVADLR